MKLLPEQFKELKKLENKWIAFTEPDKEIVGVGLDAVEAGADAERHGHKAYVLYRLLPLDEFYIGQNGF